MIKKLRYKFLGVTMLCIGLLFGAILLALNLSMTVSSQSRGFEILETAAGITTTPQNAPQLRQPGPGDAQGGPDTNRTQADSAQGEPDTDQTQADSAQSEPGTDQAHAGSAPNTAHIPTPAHRPDSYIDAFRVFSISYDKSGALLSVDYNKETGLSEADILKLGEKVLPASGSAPKERGKVQSRYLYLVRNRDTAWQIYFLDYSVEQSMTYRLFWLCLAVGLAGMGILFVAAFFLSGWMVKPVQDAFTQQKHFIADASHELKTPLTIINANAEVLSATLGQNKWLSHILEQTKRMNALIRDLLDLAKMDSLEDSAKKPAFAEFDLSRSVSSAALSFESLAFESCKTYRMQISENLIHYGDEQAIRQLVTILLDNAFSYSGEGQTVTISLSAEKKSGVAAAFPGSFATTAKKNEESVTHSALKTKKVLTVHNTGTGISAEDQKHIFERFYRSDASRSRNTGGYGLGLSIATSIAYAHRAKISVQSDGESYTQITVVL